MGRLIVFSDLDGTLLDHDTYDHGPALPAVNRLKELDALLVLASSKTAAEMWPIHRVLGLGEAPMIVENGAAFVTPEAGQTTTTPKTDSPYEQLRSTLTSLNAPFFGFGDMSDHEVHAHTGLPLAAARLAKARRFSEPGLWQGKPADLPGFLDHLASKGIHARQGGRFLTLSFGQTKADQMTRILAEYAPLPHEVTTIALGDAPNDAEMIAAADWGVVIRNDHGSALPRFADETQILRSTVAGPAGWAETMHIILDKIAHRARNSGAKAHG